MEYQEDNTERKRKIRIIAGTCVAAVLILGIGAWIIIASINGINSDNSSSVATTTASEAAPANNTKSSSAHIDNTEVVAETPKDDAEVATTTEEAAPASAASIPSTGPTEVISTALLAGVAVYLLGLNRSFLNRAA